MEQNLPSEFPVTFNNSTESEPESCTYSIQDKSGKKVHVPNKSSSIWQDEEAVMSFKNPPEGETMFFKRMETCDPKSVLEGLKENAALQRPKTLKKKVDRSLLEAQGKRVITVANGVTKYTNEDFVIHIPECDTSPLPKKKDSGLKMLSDAVDLNKALKNTLKKPIEKPSNMEESDMSPDPVIEDEEPKMKPRKMNSIKAIKTPPKAPVKKIELSPEPPVVTKPTVSKKKLVRKSTKV